MDASNLKGKEMAKTTSKEPLAMPTANKTSKKERRKERNKAVDAELQRIARMKGQKRRAEIEAVHKKSGLSAYVLRAPGSYEGGSK